MWIFYTFGQYIEKYTLTYIYFQQDLFEASMQTHACMVEFQESSSVYSSPSSSGSVFAIICHMATVLWVQTEICDGSVHSNSTVFHLHSPLAQFHYLQGIQGVMASRATNLLAISSSLPRPLLLLFKNCVCLKRRNGAANCSCIPFEPYI